MFDSPGDAGDPQPLDPQATALAALEGVSARAARVFAEQVRGVCAAAAAFGADGRSTAVVEEFLELDLAGTLRVAQRSAATLLAQAWRLAKDLPLTLSLLEAGQMYVPQALALLRACDGWDPAVTRRVETELLPAAATWNATDLARRAGRLCATIAVELDADAVRRRERAARRDRDVWVRPAADGMSLLCALLPAEKAQAFLLGLGRLAGHDRAVELKTLPPQDRRTLPEIRADVLADLPCLLLAAQHAPPPGCRSAARLPANAHVELLVTVPVATLLGASSESAHLGGHGPLTASHIHHLLPHARLRRIAVDQTTGRPIAVDPTTQHPRTPRQYRQVLADYLTPWTVTDHAEPHHDPTPTLGRLIDLRDQNCTGPGCTLPAPRCHRDHHTPWPTGPTAAWNLGLKSPRCHRAKHHGWHTQHHPDGTTTWTSPHHRTYTSQSPHPPPRLPADP